MTERRTSSSPLPAPRTRTTKAAYLPMRVTRAERATLERLADDAARWPERRSISVSECARRLILSALEREGVSVELVR